MIDDDVWNDTLTPRESECMRLVLDLHTNDAIARELDLSTNTVRNHMKAARDKLGGMGRYEAARRYAALTRGADPLRTSTERTMADSTVAAADVRAIRSSDGPGLSKFQEERAAYAHDDLAFATFPGTRAEHLPEGVRSILRLLAVPAFAAVIALLIVATPPMAESFKRLAKVIVPLFR